MSDVVKAFRERPSDGVVVSRHACERYIQYFSPGLSLKSARLTIEKMIRTAVDQGPAGAGWDPRARRMGNKNGEVILLVGPDRSQPSTVVVLTVERPAISAGISGKPLSASLGAHLAMKGQTLRNARVG